LLKDKKPLNVVNKFGQIQDMFQKI